MTDALRCTLCGISWPRTADYAKCPTCEGKTDAIGQATPLDVDEAASMKRHADFERYYAKRVAPLVRHP